MYPLQLENTNEEKCSERIAGEKLLLQGKVEKRDTRVLKFKLSCHLFLETKAPLAGWPG